MLPDVIARLFQKKKFVPVGPSDLRVYAVGDVHGRRDLLDQLLDKIEQDISSRAPRRTLIVFLGDLIDRGPDSRGVIERLCGYTPPGVQSVFLIGNHEEIFLRLLRGEPGLLRSWLTFGGSACLSSYGVDLAALEQAEETAALRIIRRSIPAAHVDFLESFVDTFRAGDFLFVHAGLRPGVPLPHQSQRDLRWIREPFLEDRSNHGMMVVHGHTISDDVDERVNRIGIDTGAYKSGILTALAIEGDQRWFLDTAPSGSPDP
jgi:serine/threonine protein phosphatase 1